jgi:hypothetical protein
VEAPPARQRAARMRWPPDVGGGGAVSKYVGRICSIGHLFDLAWQFWISQGVFPLSLDKHAFAYRYGTKTIK